MKRYPALVAALLLTLSLSAQTTPAEFAARYERLVARVGIAGAGVETLLERWEEAFPDDLKMLEGKFACYLEKSGTPKVIRLPRDRDAAGFDPVCDPLLCFLSYINRSPDRDRGIRLESNRLA